MAVIDLGGGILDDAAVETAAMVFAVPRAIARSCSFFRLDDVRDRETRFQELLNSQSTGYFLISTDEFKNLPASPFAYWVPKAIRSLFQTKKRLQPAYAAAKVGLQTGSDGTFVRFFWEVIQDSIGQGKRWRVFAKGGNYCRYYIDFNLVVDWGEDGYAIKHFADVRGKIRSRPQNEDFYFRPGLTYINISSIAFSAQLLPSGVVFSVQGQGLFPIKGYERWVLLGILNSDLVNYLLHVINPGRHFQAGHVANVPLVYPQSDDGELLVDRARAIYHFKSAWDTGNEICTRFTAPWLLQLCELANQRIGEGAEGLGKVIALLGEDVPEIALPDPPTLEALLDAVRAIEDAADARLQALQAQIDEAVYDLYEISPADRRLIERELGDRPPELVWPQMGGKSDEERRREHVQRFFSYYARQVVRQDEDGIVPLTGCAAREPYLVDRVRAQLETQFGPSVAYQLEQDGAAYLGRPVEEWLRRYFFARFHVKLYKKRPILWHLTSPRRHFAVLVDYHRLTRDTLPKVQTLYLWPHKEEVRTRLAAARANQGAVKIIADLEDELADLEETEKRLAQVIDSGYNPDIDDGVKVNLLPLQEAGLLPVKRVV